MTLTKKKFHHAWKDRFSICFCQGSNPLALNEPWHIISLESELFARSFLPLHWVQEAVCALISFFYVTLRSEYDQILSLPIGEPSRRVFCSILRTECEIALSNFAYRKAWRCCNHQLERLNFEGLPLSPPLSENGPRHSLLSTWTVCVKRR